MNDARLRHLIQYALAVAAEEPFPDNSLTTTALMKYVFLGDLAYAQRHGESFTGANWIFHYFGPWAASVGEAMPSAAIGLRGEVRPFAGGTAYSVRAGLADEVVRNIPPYVATGMRRAIKRHGNRQASFLPDVYRTKPMLHARPGASLDFSFAKRQELTVTTEPEEITARQAKKRGQKLNELKQEFKRRLAAPHRSSLVRVEPTHSDEVRQALEQVWRDDRAEAESVEGQLSVAAEIWDDAARTDDGLP